eukprot:1359590-Pyramimonas_sp.AAC.1
MCLRSAWSSLLKYDFLAASTQSPEALIASARGCSKSESFLYTIDLNFCWAKSRAKHVISTAGGTSVSTIFLPEQVHQTAGSSAVQSATSSHRRASDTGPLALSCQVLSLVVSSHSRADPKSLGQST